MRQIHGTPSGHAGNVYRHMLAQSRMGGVNLGLLPHTPGYTGSRTHRGFRQDQAAIKRHFKEQQRQTRARMRSGDLSKKEFRAQMQNLRSQHRLERRAHATGQKREFLQSFEKKGGFGKRRQWSQKMGQRFNPRARINVRQDPYTGRRHMAGYGFRQRRYSDKDMFKRREDRASKMYEWRKKHEFRGRDADFTRGSRRRGVISGGDPFAGRYGGQVLSPGGRRQMTPQERFYASGQHAPHAREFMRWGKSVPYHDFVRRRGGLKSELWEPFRFWRYKQ